MKNDIKLFIIRGIPGSGKSTTALRMLNENIVDIHVETDMYFTDEDGNYHYDYKKIRSAHLWCMSKTLDALSNNKRVAVSNTFVTKKEALAYINICKLNNIKYQILNCNGNYKNIHGVSDEKVAQMKERFQTL